VVLDFVGSDSSLITAAACVRQLGDLTIIGIAGGTLPVSFFAVAYECSVQTTYWGKRTELIEVLDLAARGRLRADLTTFPLEDAAAVYDRLAAETSPVARWSPPSTPTRPGTEHRAHAPARSGPWAVSQPPSAASIKV
jgi:D-arabinose 1-dehydrogenase-like Zn-dependent alcohol dehydrogenase